MELEGGVLLHYHTCAMRAYFCCCCCCCYLFFLLLSIMIIFLRGLKGNKLNQWLARKGKDVFDDARAITEFQPESN